MSNLDGLYEKWLENIIEKNKKNPDFNNFTKPIPLFEAFESEKSCDIMIFAKESHEEPYTHYSQKNIVDIIKESREERKKYLENPASRDTVSHFYRYLKGDNIRSKDERKKKRFPGKNILINNLNKISINGANTKINEIKGQFKCIDDEKTIYELEITHFRPKTIIFACGPSYLEQIRAAFPKCDSKRVTSDSLNIEKRYVDITDCFQYYKANGVSKIIWCFHPQRLRNKEDKDEIIEIIRHSLK